MWTFQVILEFRFNGTEANYKYKRSLRRLLSFDITVYSYRNTTLINEHRYIPSTRFERIPVSHGSHYLVIYTFIIRTLLNEYIVIKRNSVTSVCRRYFLRISSLATLNSPVIRMPNTNRFHVNFESTPTPTVNGYYRSFPRF